jgi:hypothetical protein
VAGIPAGYWSDERAIGHYWSILVISFDIYQFVILQGVPYPTSREQLGRGQAASSGTDMSDPQRAPADLLLTNLASQVRFCEGDTRNLPNHYLARLERP